VRLARGWCTQVRERTRDLRRCQAFRKVGQSGGAARQLARGGFEDGPQLPRALGKRFFHFACIACNNCRLVLAPASARRARPKIIKSIQHGSLRESIAGVPMVGTPLALTRITCLESGIPERIGAGTEEKRAWLAPKLGMAARVRGQGHRSRELGHRHAAAVLPQPENLCIPQPGLRFHPGAPTPSRVAFPSWAGRPIDDRIGPSPPETRA